jgi:hypothetical protein
MKFNINKILAEWAYRVDDGQPDVTNVDHVNHLREVLYNFGLPHKFIVEYVHGLNEDVTVQNKASGNVYAVQNVNPKTQKIIKKNASKKDLDKLDKGKDTEDKSTDTATSTKSVNKKSEIATPKNIKKSIKVSKELREDLDFILKHKDTTRLKTGAGSNSIPREDLEPLRIFTEKRKEQDERRLEAHEKGEEFNEPIYVHPNVTVREIDDKTLDAAIDYLQENLSHKEFFGSKGIIRKFAEGGAVPASLTRTLLVKPEPDTGPAFDKNSPGYKRAREIIRLYLKNDGKSPVTGKPLPLSHMEPDHRVPFSTAETDLVESGKFKGLTQKAKKPVPDGNSIGEIVSKKKGDLTEYDKKVMAELKPLMEKYDNPADNMDLMDGRVNQFKGDAIDNKLLMKIRKKLAENPEEKKLQVAYDNERTKLLIEHHTDSLQRGDTSAISERVIMNADGEERDAIMKAHNYWHPTKAEFNKHINGDPRDPNMNPDPEYYNKLKAFWANKGVELPENPDDIDIDKHPFNKNILRAPVKSQRSRGGGGRHLPDDKEIPYMLEHFRKSGYDIPTLKENEKQDDIVNEARQSVYRKIDTYKIALLKKQLENPNLTPSSKSNKEKQLAKLEKLQG